MLVPKDWRVEGGIVWRPEISNLAYLQLRLSDPQGSSALEFFPTLPFTQGTWQRIDPSHH